jgi:hypothetical protein
MHSLQRVQAFVGPQIVNGHVGPARTLRHDLRILFNTLSGVFSALPSDHCWYTKDSIRSDVSAFTRGQLRMRRDGSVATPAHSIKCLPLPSIGEAIHAPAEARKRKRYAHEELPSGRSRRSKQCTSVSASHEIEVARVGISEIPRAFHLLTTDFAATQQHLHSYPVCRTTY